MTDIECLSDMDFSFEILEYINKNKNESIEKIKIIFFFHNNINVTKFENLFQLIYNQRKKIVVIIIVIDNDIFVENVIKCPSSDNEFSKKFAYFDGLKKSLLIFSI